MMRRAFITKMGIAVSGGIDNMDSKCRTDAMDALRASWRGEPFVVVTDGSPSTKATLGSNAVHLTAMSDPRTGWVVAIAALDNLVKGASGQAIQCANLMLDLPETEGLPTVGVYP